MRILQPSQRIKRITDAALHPYPIAHATMGYPAKDCHFHTDTVYTFVTGEGPRDAPQEGESTDIRLFSRTEAISLGKEQIDRITLDTALYIFDDIFDHWQVISPSEFK